MEKEEHKKQINELIESLSPNERKILPYLKEASLDVIAKKAELDEVAVMRALEFLSNKEILKIQHSQKKIAELGINGVLYKKKGLPERRLISIIAEKKAISLSEAQKKADLTDNEFKAAIGALKKKALINVVNEKLMLSGKNSEISKKTLEEQLIDALPIELEKLKPEQKFAVDSLKNRKDIIEINQRTETKFNLTEFGMKLVSMDIKSDSNMIERLTSESIKNGGWKGKKFRRYDVTSPVPKIYGGKRQPYYFFLKEVRKKLTEIGFKEMSSDTLVSEFWNFDALFQPQFHAARDWSDTYRIKNKDLKSNLPERKIIERVKKIHEEKWKYKWDEEKAKQLILRPQGTAISSQTLSKERNGKFFAIARTYRPDVVDAKHLSEFNQVEGIVIGKDLNFANLLYILKEFAIKIANAKPENIEFRPSYFPFTEPSVEMHIKHEKLGWIEIGGAGIFRKEVTEALTGIKDKDLRVLAWGLGIDRLAMLKLGINDIRELFSSNLEFLRDEKI